MINTLDMLLIKLNKSIKDKKEIIISVDTKQLNLKYNILPVEVYYSDNGLEIIDGNGFNFKINYPDNFNLVFNSEYNNDFYVFRDYKHKEFYGICF